MLDKYELKTVYEELGQTHVSKQNGTRFWTVVQYASVPQIHIDNPATGQETLTLDLDECPDSVHGVPIEFTLTEDDEWVISDELHEMVLYAERTGRSTAKALPVSSWPDLNGIELFPDHSYEGKESANTEGSPQNISSNDLSKRTNVFRADDPRGSKNDLLK